MSYRKTFPIEVKGLCLLITLVFSLPCIAQNNIKEASIDESHFFTYQQRKSNWCWAASIQMVLAYNDVLFYQEDIVKRTVGTNYNGEIPNLGGSVQMISENLNKIEVDIAGRENKITSTFIPHAPTPNELVQILKNQQPIYLSYKSSLSTNHAVVITSCRYIETSEGYKIIDFTVRDPWPSPQNINANGILKYSYNEFHPLMNYFWIISVKIKGHNFLSSKEILNCTTPFCQTLNKILKGFDNKFEDVIDKDHTFAKTVFKSKEKFINEISNYIGLGEYASYHVWFYKGSNYDSSKACYEQIKSNLNSISYGLEDASEAPHFGMEGKENDENKYLDIHIDNRILLRLVWGYNNSNHSGLVKMGIMTEDYAKATKQ